MADLNNAPMGGWVQYSFSSTTAAWLAHHFYLHWRYSGDREFLRARAYPYLRDVATFIEAVQERDRRQAHAALSSTPEINDNRFEAWFSTLTNYDQHSSAGCWPQRELADGWRWTQRPRAGVACWLSSQSWQPVKTGASVAADYPLPESHRHFAPDGDSPLGLIKWEDGEAAGARSCGVGGGPLGPDLWWVLRSGWAAWPHGT